MKLNADKINTISHHLSDAIKTNGIESCDELIVSLGMLYILNVIKRDYDPNKMLDHIIEQMAKNIKAGADIKLVTPDHIQ